MSWSDDYLYDRRPSLDSIGSVFIIFLVGGQSINSRSLEQDQEEEQQVESVLLQWSPKLN